MISEAQIVDRLTDDEGFIPHVYYDHLGYATIGIGRLVDRSRNGGITREEGQYLLRNDVRRCVAECESRFEFWDSLDPVRQQIVICMAFQLGTNGVANFRKMIAALRIRNYSEAARQMIDSNWHKQTRARCERMANMMRSGVWQ